MNVTKLTEETRIQRQNQLDAKKTQNERNKLGQFATPTALALEIIEYSKNLLSQNLKIKFLDPAFGTGSGQTHLNFKGAGRHQKVLLLLSVVV